MSPVEILDGDFYFNGNRKFLIGGEVQYFRLRDKNFGPRETWTIWEQTLDLMARAKMNLVTTYVPWNYHETKPGVFDFTGARDLDKFIGMCAERGMLAQIKPGPYITAEWPYGPRSFGALPEWLLDLHPETAVLDRKGNPFNRDPFRAKWGRFCTYLHPAYLNRVKMWFEKVAPIISKYIHERPSVFSVQVDNETNLFWTDRYTIDYSPIALSHYRRFLEIKYVDISELNRVYGTKYKSFAEVEPPRKPNRKGPENNAQHIDWFEAGWAYVHDYLVELRRYWESLGITEPDILFTTNDTHINLSEFGWKLLWPRSAQKAAVGLPGLDAYPCNNPLSRALDHVPYQASFTARLLDNYSDRYPLKSGSWVMGAEMQGGMFDLPILNVKIRPEATARLLTQAFGHGVKAYATFVMREGFNLDNSIYHCQAPINYRGKITPRFDVLKKAAVAIEKRIGDKLLESVPAQSQAAILVNPDYQVPLGGTRLDSMEIWNRSYAGIYGWLLRAGYAVDVADIKETDDLGKWKAVVYIDPGLIGADEAEKLTDYVYSGGSLVHFGWPGDADLTGNTSSSHRRWLDMFPNRFYRTTKIGNVLVLVDDGKRYDFSIRGRLYHWEVPENAEVLLKIGIGGAACMMTPVGKGRAFHMGFDFGPMLNSHRLYNISEIDLEALVRFARKVMSRCGVNPLLDWQPRKIEVWPRFIQSSGDALLFITNDGAAVSARIKPLKGRGIDIGKRYRLYAAFKDAEIGIISGNELCTEGFQVEIDKLGSEIVLIEKV